MPAGPVYDLAQVFDDPQVVARGMRLQMDYPESQDGKVDLIANPIRMSGTPVTYRHRPPTMGEQSDEILDKLLGLSAEEIAALRERGVV